MLKTGSFNTELNNGDLNFFVELKNTLYRVQTVYKNKQQGKITTQCLSLKEKKN